MYLSSVVQVFVLCEAMWNTEVDATEKLLRNEKTVVYNEKAGSD